MKYCKKCGSELLDEAEICPKCVANQKDTIVHVAIVKDKSTGLASASLVLGIISLVLFPIAFVTGVIGLGLAIAAIIKKQGGKGIAGLVLNIIAIVTLVVGLCVLVNLTSNI